MPEFSYNAITELLTMLDLSDAAAKLTNGQLSAILIEHVWADLPIDSAASALISEVADRLDGLPEPVLARQNAHIDAYIEGLRRDNSAAIQRARIAEQTIGLMREQIVLLENKVRDLGGI